MRILNGRPHQGGYILALNIAVLAMMMVGAAYMGQRMSLARQLAQAEQARVNAEYQLESARARVMMLLATVPRSFIGLGEGTGAVMLDGQPYRIGNDVEVTLQDVRGQVSLNGLPLSGQGRVRLERLLATYGLDTPETSRLTDTLLDYRDPDDLRRLNGAEKEDYVRAGLPGQIRNGDLLTTEELARVYGWAENKKLWGDDPITQHVNVQHLMAFNPNTASWRALVAMSDLTEDMARNLVKSRRSAQVANIASLVYGGELGDPFGPRSYVTQFPGSMVVVTLRIVNSPWGYRMLVDHTPDMENAPWRIESVTRIAFPKKDEETSQPRELPEWSQLREPGTRQLQVQLPF